MENIFSMINGEIKGIKNNREELIKEFKISDCEGDFFIQKICFPLSL